MSRATKLIAHHAPATRRLFRRCPLFPAPSCSRPTAPPAHHALRPHAAAVPMSSQVCRAAAAPSDGASRRRQTAVERLRNALGIPETELANDVGSSLVPCG